LSDRADTAEDMGEEGLWTFQEKVEEKIKIYVLLKVTFSPF